MTNIVQRVIDCTPGWQAATTLPEEIATVDVLALSTNSAPVEFLGDTGQAVPFVGYIDALNNTGAFLVVLLFPGSPFGFLTALVSWGLVWFLDRRYRPDAAVRSAGRDEAA